MKKMLLVYVIVLALFVLGIHIISPIDTARKISVAVLLGSLYSMLVTIIITWANNPHKRKDNEQA